MRAFWSIKWSCLFRVVFRSCLASQNILRSFLSVPFLFATLSNGEHKQRAREARARINRRPMHDRYQKAWWDSQQRHAPWEDLKLCKRQAPARRTRDGTGGERKPKTDSAQRSQREMRYCCGPQCITQITTLRLRQPGARDGPPRRLLKLNCLLAARSYYYYYSLNSNSVQSTWTRAPHMQTGGQPHASLDKTKSMIGVSSRVYKRPTSFLVTVRTNGTVVFSCLR